MFIVVLLRKWESPGVAAIALALADCFTRAFLPTFANSVVESVRKVLRNGKAQMSLLSQCYRSFRKALASAVMSVRKQNRGGINLMPPLTTPRVLTCQR